MKIQFITNYSQLYGANRSLLSLIEYFHEKGYEVNVLLPSKGSMALRLNEKDISYQIVPYYSAFLYVKLKLKYLIVPLLAIFDILIFPLLVYKIKKFNPDIIYSNTSAENIGIFIAKLLKKKHILHVREFMSLDHNSFFIFGKRQKKRFINRSNGIIFVSNAVACNVLKNQLDNKKHIVIYNGLSTPVKIIGNKLPDFNAINFGVVGIFDPAKGQDLAIEYFNSILKTYPHSKLHLFGDKEGGYKKKMIKMIKEMNLTDHILLHGFEENTDKIYSQIDILFMFSKSEGFGRVTVEAMLNKIPVIGYDNAGTSELITNKVTGCLFKHKPEFIDGIKFIMEPKNYIAIQHNAFDIAQQKYNDQLYCINVEKFINQNVSTQYI